MRFRKTKVLTQYTHWTIFKGSPRQEFLISWNFPNLAAAKVQRELCIYSLGFESFINTNIFHERVSKSVLKWIYWAEIFCQCLEQQQKNDRLLLPKNFFLKKVKFQEFNQLLFIFLFFSLNKAPRALRPRNILHGKFSKALSTWFNNQKFNIFPQVSEIQKL